MLPLPILLVSSTFCVVVPSFSVTVLPSRIPVTSWVALSFEPANSAYRPTSWSWLCANAPRGSANANASRACFILIMGGLRGTEKRPHDRQPAFAANRHQPRSWVVRWLRPVGLRRQRLEKRDQVFDLGRREVQPLQHTLPIGVQPLLVQLRVVLHHVAQRGEAAVVHIRSGERDVA